MEEINSNFIHEIIDKDLSENPELKIHTRLIIGNDDLDNTISLRICSCRNQH